MDKGKQWHVYTPSVGASSFLEAGQIPSDKKPVSPRIDTQSVQHHGMAAISSHKTRVDRDQGYEVYDSQARGSDSPAPVTESNQVDTSGVVAVESEDTEVQTSSGIEPHIPKQLQYPSPEEVERHNSTHCPFQPWCRHCIRGRATNAPHPTRVPIDQKSLIPGIFMDYGFMSKRDEEQQTNPFFVMVDSKTNEKFARSVNQKGLGQHGEVDWLIKSVVMN